MGRAIQGIALGYVRLLLPLTYPAALYVCMATGNARPAGELCQCTLTAFCPKKPVCSEWANTSSRSLWSVWVSALRIP